MKKLVLVFLVIGGVVCAADFTIDAPQTTVYDLNGDGDTLTIEGAGEVTVTTASSLIGGSVNMNNDNQTVTLRDGTTVSMDGTGQRNSAISSDNNGSTIVLEAGSTVSCSSALGTAIECDGDSATITIGGAVTSTSVSGAAVASTGSGCTISTTAASTINTTPGACEGIVTNGANAEILHRGTITTSGNQSSGIQFSSANGTATIFSGASVTCTNDVVDAVVQGGANSSFTNAGSIQCDGRFVSCVRTAATGATVLNTGTITSTSTNTSGNPFGIQSSGDSPVVENRGIISMQYGIGVFVGTNTTGGTFTNSGTITTVLQSSKAVEVGNFVFPFTLTNSGTVGTSGDSAIGIDFESNGGSMTLTSSSVIETAGEDAYALRPYVLGGGTVSIAGQVTTTGVGANAVHLQGNNVTISNSGTITTAAESAHGFNLLDGPNTLTHSGTLSTGGSTAHCFNISGSNNTVTSSGSVETGGATSNGFNITASNNSITNNGTITTATNESKGLYCTASRLTYTGTGDITTQGADAYAIHTTAARASVTMQSGATFSTSGQDAYAVYVEGNNSTITMNAGSTISTTGNGAHGIFTEGDGTTITANSSESITTTGNDAYGIHASGNNNTVINTGSITTTGNRSHGVRVTAQDVTLNNSGTIAVSGQNASGVFASEAGFSLIHSGSISATGAGGYAIRLTGANPSLTLSEGFIIDGGIISSNDPLDLTVGVLSASTVLTVEGQGFGDLNIAEPFIRLGNNSIMILASSSVESNFAMQTDILEDLSDSILNIIYTNEYQLLHCCTPGCGAWVAGIGSLRRRNDKILSRNWQGGGMVGGSMGFCGNSALGAFVGGSWGTGRLEDDVASAHPKSYFGGLTYEGRYCNTFVGAAIAGGYFELNSRRLVVNNNVQGGIQDAKAEGQGGMLTAEVTASRWIWYPICGMRPLATFTLRYAGLFLGDYNETGSGADLHVKNRHINLLKPKFYLSAEKVGCNCDCGYSLQPYVGYAGRFQLSGTHVQTDLLNAPFNFDTGVAQNVGELLYGLYGNLFLGDRNIIFCHFQGLNDTASSSRFLGEGGWNYRF